jgi:hypothetical protein
VRANPATTPTSPSKYCYVISKNIGLKAKLILNQLSASSSLAYFQVAKQTHFTQNVTLRLKACNRLLSTAIRATQAKQHFRILPFSY